MAGGRQKAHVGAKYKKQASRSTRPKGWGLQHHGILGFCKKAAWTFAIPLVPFVGPAAGRAKSAVR
jgi:hypothetical protein